MNNIKPARFLGSSSAKVI